MSELRRDFLYYLVDLPTQSNYYIDSTGHLQKASIKADFDSSLKKSPVGWKDTGVSFGRNSTYFAVNRSFSDPFSFVYDAAKIIRNLFYGGRGIEVPLGIIILKYNPAVGKYQTYYKGNLDLSKASDKVAEGFSVNVMEGGIMQLLKAYENTTFEIPCDGSLSVPFPDGTMARNIKVNFDGMLLPDTLYYEFVPFTASYPGEAIIPTVYVDQDGDNIGTQHGDQQYQQITTGYYQTSANYNLSFVLPTKVRIIGSITVRPWSNTEPHGFGLFLATSKSVPTFPDAITPGQTLVPANQGNHVAKVVSVGQQTVYNFDVSITLDAGENLFFAFFNESQAHPVTIVGGSFSLAFNSSYPATRVWAITGWDLFRVIIKNICALSSTTSQTFDYQAVSQLLQDNLNLVVTCGDALRASSDPNYAKYFNALQNNPNFPNINQYYSYGPAIKISLRKFFNSFSTFLMGALGNQVLPGQQESIFFESLRYVFNSDADIFDIGEVTDLTVSVDLNHIFNILKVGYQPNTYDQVAGKYEPNTTLEMQAPIKTVSKTLEIISDIRTDAYGIEKVRSNIGNTSTTRNNSDSDAFAVSVDYSKSIFDFFSASFLSNITNTANANNTNTLLLHNKAQQAVEMTVLDGGYFTQNNDPCIFVFNQPSLSAHSYLLTLFNLNVTLFGNPANALTGLPADTVTIKLFVNGIVLNTWIITATGPSTSQIINYSTTRAFSYKDCIYMTMATSINGTANVTSGSIQVDTAGAYFNANVVGIVTALPGTPQKLIEFPTVNAILDAHGLPVISYNFQYFTFNDILINSNFDLLFTLSGLMNGFAGQTAGVDLFLNGVVVDTATWTEPGGQVPIPAVSFSLNRDFVLGDIIFVTGSAQNLSAWFTAMNLIITSTSIRAYSLLRLKYDLLVGIPNLALDANGIPDSSLPGAPFNLEPFTPKTILNTWSGWLRSMLFNQIPGKLFFSTLSKNQYLSRTYKGVTIIENADVDISSMDAPIVIPLIMKAKTEVPANFDQLMTGAANAHIGFKYNNKRLYGFCNKMTQKSFLNEAQEWEMLCSPKTNLADLIDMNIDGINFLQMAIYNISASLLNPIKFVPATPPSDPRYSNLNMDQDLYVNRVTDWTDSSNYAALWLQSDAIKLQFLSYGLSPVVAQLYDCNDRLVNSYNFSLASSPAVNDPMALYEVSIPLAAVAMNVYYFKVQAGTGTNLAKMRSEPIRVMPSWPLRTLMFGYKSTVNTLSTIFDDGYNPTVRVEGWISDFNPRGVYSSFTDQQQDFVIIKGVPYRKYRLNIGMNAGIPDYMIDLLGRILLLDTVVINGVQYTRLAGDTQLEAQSIPGQPKDLWSIEIREAVSRNALTVGIDGGFNNDITVVATIDTSAWGNQTGEDLLQVNLNA